MRTRLEWRKRQIILPETLVERLFEWHGGQSTPTYALASTGMRDLVSLSMIDAAQKELSRELNRTRRGATKKELNAVVDGLMEVRLYWKEHSAQEAGMDVETYDYDRGNYGLDADEEAVIDVRSR